MKRQLLVATFLLPVLLASIAFAKTQNRPPINIKVKNPDILAVNGVLLSGGWAFVFEFEVQGAIGVVGDDLPNAVANQALILKDPDGCINMQNWIAPGDPPVPIEGCANPPDESFIRFTPDPIDSTGIAEVSGQNGITLLQDALRDDAFDVLNLANLNRQYFDNGFGGSPGSFVGVVTESSIAPLDGYGYGVNDDFPGLYIWADIGTGIVADQFLNRVPDPVTGANKLRNMAGLVNGVFYTQLTAFDRTSIVAVMNVNRGVLEPVVQFDFIAVDPDFGTASSGFLRRLDDGPVQVIPFPDTTPRFQNDAFNEVFASLGIYEVIVSVAVVEGQASPFIQDLDGNGRYDRRDLLLAGHTLLSDVQRYRVRAIQIEALDSGPFECPPGNIFKEARLDSDTDFGIGCSTGSARSVVRPPR